MNKQLIDDEGHRNPMNSSQLRERMADWLQTEYEAVLFEENGVPIGYALFKRNLDFAYIRQIFVSSERRRQGIASHALRWLWANAWTNAQGVRIEVLIGNAGGRAFWRSVGFKEYCITMEALRPEGKSSK